MEAGSAGGLGEVAAVTSSGGVIPLLLCQPWLRQQLRQKGGWGRGGQSFAKEEAGILVGNHSNEAMKPEPCLRTNWPDWPGREGSYRESGGGWALAEGEGPGRTPLCVPKKSPGLSGKG